jgi:hypothetical protein
MPLTTSNPEIVDGVEYPYFGLSMAMMPIWGESNLGAMIAVEFPIFRVDSEGKVVRAVDEDGKFISRHRSFADAFASDDPDLQAAIATVLGAVQAYITAKGI